jgi:glycosyltransferase involved in cell wall biosynthesis
VRDDGGNVDGLPNVLMEALASGTPVVTTAAGGILSVVDDGVTAFVVPERDSTAIAACIGRIVEQPALGRQVGAAARRLVDDRFGWDRAAERFEAAYASALAFTSARS